MKDECYKTRKLILPSVNRGEVELLTPELEEAILHLKECKECQSFYERQDELRKFLKAKLQTTNVPASVREEIFNSISKKKDKKLFSLKYYSRYWWAAAIIVALTISLLLIIPSRQSLDKSKITETHSSEISGSQLTEALVDDYIRYRLSEQPAEFATNNPQELNNWFSGKLDFNARFSNIDKLQLVGGRLCYLFDRRVALAFYSQSDMQNPGRWISFKDDHINLSKMKTEKLKNKTVWCGERGGYELAVWRQNDLLYALVTDGDCMGLTERLNSGTIE